VICGIQADPFQGVRHFGPKTFWHHLSGHFGTGTELSRSLANFFATIGRTEERFTTGYYYY